MEYRFGNGFAVRSFYHTTTVVKNMSETKELFQRLFGAPSMTIPYAMNRYAQFTFLGDVPLESTSPNTEYATAKRMFLQLAGDHWTAPVFWTRDLDDGVHRFALDHGIKVTDLWTGMPVNGVSEGPMGGKHYYTSVFDAGVDCGLYEFDDKEPRTTTTRSNTDPFTLAGTYEPPAPRQDVISVERHAQHVIVTSEQDRVVRFFADVLGGKIFHQAENEQLATQSTYISLGERPFTMEVATPTGDGDAARDLDRLGTIYHRLDLKVHDLDAAVAHAEKCGVQIAARGDGFAVIGPDGANGLRFGLFRDLAPGDPRLA